MSSNKKYRLLKDLPQLPKGSIFEWYLNNGTCDLYSCGGTEYSEPFIKQKTDWFELIEDKFYSAGITILLRKDTHTGNYFDRAGNLYTIKSDEKKYTEKELLEAEQRAFNAARKGLINSYADERSFHGDYYRTFSHYKNRTK